MAAKEGAEVRFRRKEKVGERIGKLVILEHLPKDLVNCMCDCGTKKIVRLGHMRDGHVRSCGCLRTLNQPNLRHGHNRTGSAGTGPSPEYTCWQNIKNRCCNPHNISYKNYGGRGIKVCERWAKSFHNFLNDVGLRPGPRYSLDRIDHDGDYVPDNVRWATWKEQHRNRRNNRLLTHSGETMPLAAWAERLCVKESTLAWRIKYKGKDIAFQQSQGGVR